MKLKLAGIFAFRWYFCIPPGSACLSICSNILVVPDQQEAFVNDDGSISVIIEVLEYQHVPDAKAAECVDQFVCCSKRHGIDENL